MQNEIYGSLATIQYHAECINPVYGKFRQAIKFVFISFAANLTRSLLAF